MVIGYARVSTEQQDTAGQFADLKKAGCKRIDQETMGGGTLDRPELEKCLDRLEQGDTLVVWRLDRLGRSIRNLLQIVDRLDTSGINFISLNENFDTSTAAGRLVFHFFACRRSSWNCGASSIPKATSRSSSISRAQDLWHGRLNYYRGPLDELGRLKGVLDSACRTNPVLSAQSRSTLPASGSLLRSHQAESSSSAGAGRNGRPARGRAAWEPCRRRAYRRVFYPQRLACHSLSCRAPAVEAGGRRRCYPHLRWARWFAAQAPLPKQRKDRGPKRERTSR